jgi:hypothetical protein
MDRYIVEVFFAILGIAFLLSDNTPAVALAAYSISTRHGRFEKCLQLSVFNFLGKFLVKFLDFTRSDPVYWGDMR